MIVEFIPASVGNIWHIYADELERRPDRYIYLDFNRLYLDYQDIGLLLMESYSKYTVGQLPDLVIITIGEAPGIDDFLFLPQLKEKYPEINVIHVTTGWDKPNDLYMSVTDPGTFLWTMESRWKDAYSSVATHHYIALARIPRAHRTRFINTLLNEGLAQYGHFSIGSALEFAKNPPKYYYESFREQLGIDVKNLKYFPTLLDGEIVQDCHQSSYDIVDDRIKNALVNVVLESSFEIYHFKSWKNPMMTEKTVKAFALGQIPMILGPAGQVSRVRGLGFDMFDDYIDHSYDLELDPIQRISQFTKSLKEFIYSTPTPHLQQLKDKLRPRFEKNILVANGMRSSPAALNKFKRALDTCHNKRVSKQNTAE